MLSQLTASRFDKRVDEIVGRTRPFSGAGCSADGTEVEIFMKLRAGCDSGIKALVAEAIAAMLASDLDLPVPEPFLLSVEADFAESICDLEACEVARKSIGINFASKKLSAGFSLWTADRVLPKHQRQIAGEIVAFDFLIGNDDRRAAKPNCLYDGKDLAIIDHEKAFPHQTSFIIGWQPPWENGGLAHKRQPASYHLFTKSVAGQEIDFRRLEGAWAAISDHRLDEYWKALPQEWVEVDDASRKILDYVRDIRERLPAAIDEIKRVLSS